MRSVDRVGGRRRPASSACSSPSGCSLPADGRRAGLVRRAGAELGGGRLGRRPVPRAARHASTRCGGWSARTSSRGCSTTLQPAPDLGPPPDGDRTSRRPSVDGVVPVDREGRGRSPAAGSRRAAASSSARPRRHQRPRGRRRGRDRSSSAATAPRCARRSSPSTPTATSPCSRAADLDRPALPIGDIDEGGVGAVFGHPGGGPLRAAPFEVGQRVDGHRHRHLRPSRRPERRCSSSPSDLRPGDSRLAPSIDPQRQRGRRGLRHRPGSPGVAYALAIERARRRPRRRPHPPRRHRLLRPLARPR